VDKISNGEMCENRVKMSVIYSRLYLTDRRGYVDRMWITYPQLWISLYICQIYVDKISNSEIGVKTV